MSPLIYDLALHRSVSLIDMKCNFEIIKSGGDCQVHSTTSHKPESPTYTCYLCYVRKTTAENMYMFSPLRVFLLLH